MQAPHIYLGTGGYSDTDLIGTLYPFGTDKSDFLTIDSQHYDAIEINRTFHAPIGAKALQGMGEKAKFPDKFANLSSKTTACLCTKSDFYYDVYSLFDD